MSINKAILIGNLGGDPEVRTTAGGKEVCNFSLATEEKWTDREGNKQKRVEWHRVVVFGAMAGACGKYLSRGRKCYVEGKIQTEKWEGEDGVARYTTRVVAQNVQFLGGGKDSGSGGFDGGSDAGEGDGLDDDIPF